MASPKTIISFKAAPLTFIPISIALAIIAIIIPIYLYPGFFVADFLNLFPYVIMLIFIFYYNREKYMKLATIEIHEDRLYIIKPSEKNSVKFNEISEIKRMPEIDRKLFSVKLESGKNMGLYDRYLKEYKMNFIDFLSVRSGINILVPV